MPCSRLARPLCVLMLVPTICSHTRAASADTTVQSTVNEEAGDSVDRDYSADMPRFPAVEPDAALALFTVEPGFQIELAAAEPVVTDPVAMEFDEHGRLFVVEMLGYSEDAEDKLGRIRLLEDANRDGLYECSTVYADQLAWPTAVINYDGGIFVGAAPDILYYKDADGDGKAEERRVAFTGFGTSNVQGLLNSFRWGLDNRIHVAVSSCGAELRRGDQPNAAPLVLRGRNFAFDPRTLEFEATSGASQHGMCFDSQGNQFTCANSDHIQQVMMEERHLSRNPFLQPPAVLKSIALEGPAADVIRMSPVEPWREIRTRLRTKGIVPGIVEGGGRAAGYFTSATGVTIFTGDAWPQEYIGNAFIGDVGSNLVHRKIIDRSQDAIPLVARRATPNREFVASQDTWFRPVQFANGPDGNLYILDMYREVIEHPASLPPVLKKHLDLTNGRDRGRIYRVVSAGVSIGERNSHYSRALPGDANVEELVQMLAHPNGWHRTTAARLLYEMQDIAIVNDLQKLATSDQAAEARILALYGLSSLHALGERTLLAAIADKSPLVRQHAVRLTCEQLSDNIETTASVPVLEAALGKAANDADLAVRFQAAMALGDCRSEARLTALASIAVRDVGEPYVAAAVLSSLGEDAVQFAHAILTNGGFTETKSGRAFILELTRQVGARADDAELAALAGEIAATRKTDVTFAAQLLAAALEGAGARQVAVRRRLELGSGGVTEEIARSLFAAAVDDALNNDAPVSRRIAAIESLPMGKFEEAGPVLADLLAARQPPAIQTAALAAIAQFGEVDLATPIVNAIPGMSPSLRMQAADLLVSRIESARQLLAAVDEQRLSPRDFDPSTIQKLKTHPDRTTREQAKELLDAAAPKRMEVVEDHRDVLNLSGDAERGRELFRKNCAICHRRDGYGTEVGADLATVVTRTPEALLISILDPNREVDPRYMQYSVLTVDGLAKSGIIAAETATSVTFKREENSMETIPRGEIEELRSTGMTLMPEGFEKVLDRQALADLIAYLRS